jgi:hypothetical protein
LGYSIVGVSGELRKPAQLGQRKAQVGPTAMTKGEIGKGQTARARGEPRYRASR